jgi:competence protein ComGC
VVLAIIGVLVAIVVPNFSTLIGSGQTEVCEMEERLVQTAVIAYALVNEVCPSSIEDLAPYLIHSEDIMGNYSFGGTCPDCTVSQDSCP